MRSVEGSGVFVTVRRGTEVIGYRTFTMARDQLLFSSASDFAGMALQKGDTVQIMIYSGSAIPLYSLTDNKTNDPALYYPPTRTLLDLSYFELP